MKKVNLIDGTFDLETTKDIEVVFARYDKTCWPACELSFKEDLENPIPVVEFFNSEGYGASRIAYKDIDIFIEALQQVKQHVEESGRGVWK